MTRLREIETVVIPNAVAVPVPQPDRKADGLCRLIYLGRLHPKKGLDLLCDAMARLPRHFHLDIYGEGDAAYVADIQRRAAASDRRIVLHGHVDGAQKHRVLATADLFVLPSHSENFGIAVAEALAHGTPVLTTTATPWTDLEMRGCGRAMDLQKEDLAQAIRDLSDRDLAAMGARGMAWMRRDFSHDAMVQGFAELYKRLGQLSAGVVQA